MLAKEIEDKTFALNAGQYTQPIRTKQGFIILQVAQQTPAVRLASSRWSRRWKRLSSWSACSPRCGQYLTKLRGEAYVEIKPGVVDTGSSGNEMQPEL